MVDAGTPAATPVGGVPAVVVGAPASGSGKTILGTGLIAALRRTGRDVAPFKVGPDYIDPGYHALAAGRVGRNLDAVMCGERLLRPLFDHGSRGADVAVVEGVMGLFDGRIAAPGGSRRVAGGSTAHVAAALGAPVVLIVDVRGHSQSIAALVHGFATWDAGVRIGGIILNRVGSARHEAVLTEACGAVGIPVLGAVPRLASVDVPSRHLGLITAAEHGMEAVAAVEAMGDLVARHVDVDAVAALASTRTPPPGEDPAAWDPAAEIDALGGPVRGAPVVAIAGGPAFTFGYAEYRELLEAAGARVVVVDPRVDDLPEETGALVLPGGFPEEHAAELAANTAMLRSVAALADAGAPIHAECAGLLYLARSLDGHRMAGVIDVDTAFGAGLTLGYRDAVALADSPQFAEGERITGHEFHRTRLEGTVPDGLRAWAWRAVDDSVTREGFVRGGVHASYLHTHPAARPSAVRGLVAVAR